jgi:multiple sugar transport system substrate-binding protein
MNHMRQLVVWGLLLSLLVGACAPANAPAPAAPAEEAAASAVETGASGHVTWWLNVNPVLEPIIPGLLEDYKQVSPNVEVTVEHLPEVSHLERLLPALASGEGPDIFYLGFVPRGTWETVALELTPFMDGPNGVDLTQWTPDVMSFGMMDGNHYGLPWAQFPGGWFYNKALLDAAGVEYPEYGWTWSQLLELAPKVTDNEQHIYGVSVGATPPSDSFGFSPVSADGKTVLGNFDSPEAFAAFSVWKQLYDCCSPTIDQQATEFQDVLGGGAGQMGAFLSGRVAFASLDVNLYSEITKAGIDWGYIHAPWADDPALRHRSQPSVVHFAINKNVQDADAAWDFLKWLTSPTGGIPHFARGGYFVTLRQPLEEAGYPQEILDVEFAQQPAEWGAPMPPLWSIACFDEAGLGEWESTGQEILQSDPDQMEAILKAGAERTQQAVDSCWEKRQAGQ